MPQAAPEFLTARAALTFPFAYDEEELPDLGSTIERQFGDDEGEVAAWARQFVGSGATIETGTLLMTLCYAIHESFVYQRRNPARDPAAADHAADRGAAPAAISRC